MTELEALLNGLNIGHTYNLMPIENEINSIETMELLENIHLTYGSTLLSCRSTLKKLGNLVVCHSFRQGNKVDNILSRLGCKLTQTNNSLILLTLPDIAKKKLKANQDGVSSSTNSDNEMLST
ncbi:hypothetical protein H5410_015722 [Solanum commersonii]|uniref:Uncharacterized protein n=1 Tax=Solanum commersonii TaxID=4109 RepID=A0A9J5ZV88_SOLCO|nr:hypothetical protein H5410_015722 [Solanum commersonii]